MAGSLVTTLAILALALLPSCYEGFMYLWITDKTRDISQISVSLSSTLMISNGQHLIFDQQKSNHDVSYPNEVLKAIWAGVHVLGTLAWSVVDS